MAVTQEVTVGGTTPYAQGLPGDVRDPTEIVAALSLETGSTYLVQCTPPSVSWIEAESDLTADEVRAFKGHTLTNEQYVRAESLYLKVESTSKIYFWGPHKVVLTVTKAAS